MARSKKNKKGEEGENGFFEFDSRLHPYTLQAVLAIILVGLSVIMILSAFDRAGPAGRFIYDILARLFGWGYFLWPATLFVAAGVLLSSRRTRPIPITLLGAIFFIISSLGLIDVVFPEQSGMTGALVGTIEIPFGYGGAMVMLITFLAAAAVMTLNLPLKISWNWLKNKSGATTMEPTIHSPAPPPIEAGKDAPENNDDAETEEKESEEKPDSENRPKGFFSDVFSAKKTRIKKSENYVYPPINLLKSSVEKPTIGDLRANANIIKRTLESFGIPVDMGEITVGPAVTRYTLKPAEGVKISRITALNQDLALALAAHPIRIEAPIPGRSLVGVEVPNKAAALVRLGSLMAYPEFQTSGPLTFILGRDVSGEPIFLDIARMPHLLIGGSTGSGKSVAIHSLLISLLYKNSPETLKLILIDPKRVELSIYEGAPHLIAPVVTDGKKTIGVFRWAIQEMEKRYELLLSAGARDIKSYNEKNRDNVLPYILIVIDELADLMAAYGREIEGSVVRLAQMARATGLHLVVSTQRPSVEVITGLIKANITSRVALQVASQVDSRTILDTSGAEKLLGSGDLLFVSAEISKPKRIQGAYVSEEEIHKVADFIKTRNKPAAPEDSEESDDSDGTELFENDENAFDEYLENDDDELYDEAVKTVTEAKKASASLLQRRLKIGYARAARLLDIMESRGLIGPGEGAKPREIFMEKIKGRRDNADE